MTTIVSMSTVGIRELKSRLTKYLRQTRLGDEIVITDRGQPIAVIQPIEVGKQSSRRETRLAAMAARGLLSLPTHRPKARVRLVKLWGAPLSQTILENRR